MQISVLVKRTNKYRIKCKQWDELLWQVAGFIGAASAKEIVFTRNASEAINLVAHAWGTHNLKPGDEVRAARGYF